MAMTTGQAAAVWGVTRSTAYRWASTGKVRAVKAGIRWIVPDAEVQRVKEEGAVSDGNLAAVMYRLKCKDALRQLAEYHGVPMVGVVEALIQQEWHRIGGDDANATR